MASPVFAGGSVPFSITRSDELKDHVGQTVELFGIVSRTKCPQVLGVDLWELEAQRGRRVKVTGVLKQQILTREELDKELRGKGAFANRGPGTFYSLTNLHYEVQP